MNRNDLVSAPLGAVVRNTERKPQRNYVKHAVAASTLREHFSVNAKGQLTYAPPTPPAESKIEPPTCETFAYKPSRQHPDKVGWYAVSNTAGSTPPNLLRYWNGSNWSTDTYLDKEHRPRTLEETKIRTALSLAFSWLRPATEAELGLESDPHAWHDFTATLNSRMPEELAWKTLDLELESNIEKFGYLVGSTSAFFKKDHEDDRCVVRRYRLHKPV